ncbi:hypothetical protein HNR44_002563 [Geomicrobium halophilum]|uniref:Uncharacterized protein n=1 Tax=Geomicrobium halophilum TaxID=549000 RepID=A0A841PP88_9BACL|nr:hypothetical protein [Geomicrobium halophilum]MBB6450580.1 hypothetical protein [Geomicrobium halophilum]
MSKQRVTYTWKIGTERHPEAINDWLDAQSNIRDSLSFLVQIMQERFGNVDVRDIEVSKELIQFMNAMETSGKVERPPSHGKPSTSSNQASDQEKEVDDDLFSGIDDKAIFNRR